MNQNELSQDPSAVVPVSLKIPDLMDELELDESSFKPVTKGLGFHQEVKQKHFTPKVVSATKLSVSLDKKNTDLGKSIAKNFDEKNQSKKMSMSTSVNASKNALSAFYAESTIVSQSETSTNLDFVNLDKLMPEKNKNTKKSDASAYAQLLAFFVDLALVLSFTTATVAALVAVSRIDAKVLYQVISLQDQIVFGSSLFIIYFLLYFTILDLNASPGKALFGIRLYTANGAAVSARHTFGRAVITLLSVAALMLPTILDFQGRLSGTKVFKD